MKNNTKERITVLIADDHALLRHGLVMVFALHNDLSVVGEAKNGFEAIKLAKATSPDVVIMDLSMPGMDGVEATRLIHEAVPSAKILILTTFGTSVDVARALREGASGALVKDAGDDELVKAIRSVAAGKQVFSREIKAMLKNEPEPPELTERQRELLASIVKGLASEAIAADLGISAYSVNQQLDAIRKKLGAANRTEAVAIALRKHLPKI